MFNGDNIFSLLNYVCENEFKQTLVYFHNLSYDSSFIIKQNIVITDVIICDG